jgi:hypothetical protein
MITYHVKSCAYMTYLIIHHVTCVLDHYLLWSNTCVYHFQRRLLTSYSCPTLPAMVKLKVNTQKVVDQCTSIRHGPTARAREEAIIEKHHTQEFSSKSLQSSIISQICC